MHSHSAPPVAYPSGRSLALGLGLLVAWLAAVLAVAASVLLATELDWRAAVTGTTLVLSGLALLHAWRHQPQGRLAWDGQAWHWERMQAERQLATSPVSLEVPDVLLDFQSALLLRLKSAEDGAGWNVWMERGAAQPRWLDVRRALYARPSAAHTRQVAGHTSDNRPARV